LTCHPVAGQTANQVPVFEGESKKLPAFNHRIKTSNQNLSGQLAKRSRVLWRKSFFAGTWAPGAHKNNTR